MPGKAARTLVYRVHPDGSAGISQTSRLTLAESDGHQTQDVLLAATTRGVGIQRVTVPRGTFDAQVVIQHIIETAGSKRVDIDLTYWLVAGFSAVKSVQTVTDATQTRTETLLLRSVTRPPPSG